MLEVKAFNFYYLLFAYSGHVVEYRNKTSESEVAGSNFDYHSGQCVQCWEVTNLPSALANPASYPLWDGK